MHLKTLRALTTFIQKPFPSTLKKSRNSILLQWDAGKIMYCIYIYIYIYIYTHTHTHTYKRDNDDTKVLTSLSAFQAGKVRRKQTYLQ